MMKLYKGLIVLLLCGSFGLAAAQRPMVEAAVDSTVLLIGEQAKVSFSVTHNRNSKLTLPIFADSLVSGIEIVEQKLDTTTIDANLEQIIQTLTVTSFDSALYYIPPFKFAIDSDTFLSNGLSLKVISIPVDTAQQAIADIKPVVKPPFDWQAFLLQGGLFLLLLAAVGLIIWIILRIKRRPKPIEEAPLPEIIRPAHEIALAELEQMRIEKPWQDGRSKQYYIALTDVLRSYIEQRYNVATFERTSNEILDSLSFMKSGNTAEAFNTLRHIFQISDLVKFAKMQPTINDHTGCLQDAVQFVTTTIPQEETPRKEDKSTTGSDANQSTKNATL